MEIKDLVGLSEPLKKLLEIVANGTGILFEPTRLKRIANAEAVAFKIKTDSIESAFKSSPEAAALALVSSGNKIELKQIEDIVDRAVTRITHKENMEQQNLEAIIANSIQFLGDNVSEKGIDQDWSTRFFEKARNVSHQDMQKVWSKILAGEINEPGSFSLRTLETLSNLSQEEAELFRRFSPYVVNIGIVLLHHNQVTTKGFNSELNYKNLIMLQDAGLLTPKEHLEVVKNFEGNQRFYFQYPHGKLIFINPQSEAKSIVIKILKLTTPGAELVGLLNVSKWTDEYEIRISEKYNTVDIAYVSNEGE